MNPFGGCTAREVPSTSRGSAGLEPHSNPKGLPRGATPTKFRRRSVIPERRSEDGRPGRERLAGPNWLLRKVDRGFTPTVGPGGTRPAHSTAVLRHTGGGHGRPVRARQPTRTVRMTVSGTCRRARRDRCPALALHHLRVTRPAACDARSHRPDEICAVRYTEEQPEAETRARRVEVFCGWPRCSRPATLRQTRVHFPRACAALTSSRTCRHRAEDGERPVSGEVDKGRPPALPAPPRRVRPAAPSTAGPDAVCRLNHAPVDGQNYCRLRSVACSRDATETRHA